MKSKNIIKRVCYSALLLAVAYVLPLLTGQIPSIGGMLSPMHIPAILAGFILGPWWGCALAFIMPLTRSVFFSIPPMYPVAVAMAAECACYALVCGLGSKVLPKKIQYVYISQIAAMIIGRFVYACVIAVIASGKMTDGFFMYFIYLFTSGIPGIILHLVIIPPVVAALRKAHITSE